MTVYTLKQLHDKRAKLSREIIQLEERTRALRADLVHVEATIRFLWPDEQLPTIVPRRVERRPRHFKRGALAKLILDYMREHVGEAVAVVDIMPIATTGRQLSAADYQRAAIGVYGALCRAERRGIIVREGDGRKAARWRLIH